MSNESEAEAVEEEADTEDAETESGLQSGDVVKLAYTARTVDGDQLVDTTHEDVAADEGIDTDQQEWGPRTIVLGEGHIFPDVEQAIIGSEVGDEGSVTIDSEDAFGEYDEEQVRTVSKDKIGEDDRYPGAQVTIDGEQGRVETIIGGRARVDFNHPLAGEDVAYEFEILEEVTDREEKAAGVLELMLDMRLDVWFETETVEEEQLVESEASDEDSDEADEESEPEYETVEVEKETLYIEATPQLTMNQQWMMGKQQIAQQLTQLLDVDRIIVQEELGGGMGMPGMMGGMGGGGGMGDIEDALEDADVDADEIMDEIEGAEE